MIGNGETHYWALVLAGGEGFRLRSLTKASYGDERPKQFCKLLGEYSIPETTRMRIEPCIAGDRILLSLSAKHRRYFKGEVGLAGSPRLIQSASKGTAPPIAHGIACIADSDPLAKVAVLPCDHHFEKDNEFLETLMTAFRLTGQSRARHGGAKLD